MELDHLRQLLTTLVALAFLGKPIHLIDQTSDWLQALYATLRRDPQYTSFTIENKFCICPHGMRSHMAF